MGIVNWLVEKHHDDLAAQALRRIRSGYPLPGDIQRAQARFGTGLSDLLDVEKPPKQG